MVSIGSCSCLFCPNVCSSINFKLCLFICNFHSSPLYMYILTIMKVSLKSQDGCNLFPNLATIIWTCTWTSQITLTTFWLALENIMCISTSLLIYRLTVCPYKCIFILGYLGLNYIKKIGEYCKGTAVLDNIGIVIELKLDFWRKIDKLYCSFQTGSCKMFLREIKLSALNFSENVNMGYHTQFCSEKPHFFPSKRRRYVSHCSVVKLAWAWIWLLALTFLYI